MRRFIRFPLRFVSHKSIPAGMSELTQRQMVRMLSVLASRYSCYKQVDWVELRQTLRELKELGKRLASEQQPDTDM